jgi:hypothetical protein
LSSVAGDHVVEACRAERMLARQRRARRSVHLSVLGATGVADEAVRAGSGPPLRHPDPAMPGGSSKRMTSDLTRWTRSPRRTPLARGKPRSRASAVKNGHAPSALHAAHAGSSGEREPVGARVGARDSADIPGGVVGPTRGRETQRMGDHVGSEAADCEHDGLAGRLNVAGVKALRPLPGRPSGPALTPAQQSPSAPLSEHHGGYAAKSPAGRCATPPGALCERSHPQAYTGSSGTATARPPRRAATRSPRAGRPRRPVRRGPAGQRPSGASPATSKNTQPAR